MKYDPGSIHVCMSESKYNLHNVVVCKRFLDETDVGFLRDRVDLFFTLYNFMKRQV